MTYLVVSYRRPEDGLVGHTVIPAHRLPLAEAVMPGLVVVSEHDCEDAGKRSVYCGEATRRAEALLREQAPALAVAGR